MKDEITLLREENERLKAFLNLLIQQVSLQHSAIHSVINSFHPGNPIGINSTNIEPNRDGTIHNSTSNDQSHNGTADNFNNYFQSRTVPADNSSNYELSRSVPANNLSNYEQSRQATGHNSVTSTSSLAYDLFLKAVCLQLKTVMPLNWHKSLQWTGSLLVYMQSNTKHSYEMLGKVTGHSKGGVAKLLGAMKRRKLITRKAYQHFILTDKANALLQSAAAMSERDIVNAVTESRGF